jgi:hypothetical protein
VAIVGGTGPGIAGGPPGAPGQFEEHHGASDGDIQALDVASRWDPNPVGDQC